MDGGHQSSRRRALPLQPIVDWITDQPWLVMATLDIDAVPAHPALYIAPT